MNGLLKKARLITLAFNFWMERVNGESHGKSGFMVFSRPISRKDLAIVASELCNSQQTNGVIALPNIFPITKYGFKATQ